MTIQQKLHDDMRNAQLSLRAAQDRLLAAQSDVDREQWRVQYIKEVLAVERDSIPDSDEPNESFDGNESASEVDIREVVDQIIRRGKQVSIQVFADEAIKLGYGGRTPNREKVINNLSAYLHRKAKHPESTGIKKAGRGEFVLYEPEKANGEVNGQEVHV